MKNRNEEKIIHAARSVFLKFGYKRVTMNDIAEAAKMSRPNVYLSFPNKESVFKALFKQIALQNLNDIQKGLADILSPKKQLQFAFEIWLIRPYELVKKTPDFGELLYSTHAFCQEISEEVGTLFEAELINMLKPLLKTNKSNALSAKKIAHLLRSAARGFKETAQSTSELRQMTNDLIDIVVTAITL